MEELKRSRHWVGGSNYHIQLTPKYRRKIFNRRHMRELVKAIFRMKFRRMGIGIGAIEFGPDHVHMFLTECGKYNVPAIIQHIKGFSSWYLRMNYWDMVKGMLWGDAFWSRGNFYESIWRVTMNTVKFYINRRQRKHWMHESAEVSGNAGGVVGHRHSHLDGFRGAPNPD